jgi:primase-polymerase (primpol)-like protein
MPICPKTGRYASILDSATWGSFHEAVAWISPYSMNSGVGFVFSETDPYVGITIDYCRNPKTGKIDKKIWQYIKSLNSYTEISEDGRGVLVIAKADGFMSNYQNGVIRLISCKKSLAITGMHLSGTPLDVHERTSEVSSFCSQEFSCSPELVNNQQSLSMICGVDELLIRQISNSHDGRKFQLLMGGDSSEYCCESEAVFALCALLAKWTTDARQVERIFQSSSLFSQKWQNQHGGIGLTFAEMIVQLVFNTWYL